MNGRKLYVFRYANGYPGKANRTEMVGRKATGLRPYPKFVTFKK